MADYNEIPNIQSRLDDLEKRLSTLETAGRLQAAGISGTGGLTVHSGGELAIEDGGNFNLLGGGSVYVEAGGDMTVSGSGAMTVRDGGEFITSGVYEDTAPDQFDSPIFFGDIYSEVDGTYTGTGLLVQETGFVPSDRVDAFQSFGTSASRHEIVMSDNSSTGLYNYYLFAVLSNTPRGLSHPFLGTLIANTDGRYWPSSTGGSFVYALEGEMTLWHDKVRIITDMYCTDGSTSGEARVVVVQGAGQTQIGPTVGVSGTGAVNLDTGYVSVPVAIGSRFFIRVDGRRTAGAGQLRMRIRLAQFVS